MTTSQLGAANLAPAQLQIGVPGGACAPDDNANAAPASVAVHQPNYLPWAGFFGKALDCNILILQDDVEFGGRSYTNRVTIKTSQGVQWLTQPVLTAGHGRQQIRQLTFAGTDWHRKHAVALKQSYGRAPYFDIYFTQLRDLLGDSGPNLAICNERLIRWVIGELDCQVTVLRASDLVGEITDPTRRLVALAQAVGATTYVSGAGGFNYQSLNTFTAAGIQVVRSRGQFPAHRQLWGPFAPGLSILDLLFNLGPESGAYLRMGVSGPAAAIAPETES